MREASERRRDDEHAEGDQEHPPPPEQVGGSAPQQQEPAVAEDVGAHHPLQRRRGHVEVGADRRQRDADHRDVEGVEEEGAAQHEQRTPGAAAQPLGAVERRGLLGGDGHLTPSAFAIVRSPPYIDRSMFVKQYP